MPINLLTSIGTFSRKFLSFPKLPNCFGGWNLCIFTSGAKTEQSQTKGSWWEAGREWRMSSKEAEPLTSFTAPAFELLSSYKYFPHLCSSVCPAFLGTFFFNLLINK